jgi:transcription-repair coupling factor (superfamily II helicase)
VLHNRVETIDETAAHIQELISAARLRSAHGQMDESSLEDTMLDFHERRFDVLVCTTIIEAGVDIPNANTLIVNDADQLGLAQLYQLRGRVGRTNRQAYAIFLYQDATGLTEIARERLAALQKYAELGSGQKIALRDMELRGAGSLLGLEQSGPVAAVGLDIYMRLLRKAVDKVRGGKVKRRPARLPPVDLPVSSYLPADYIPSERERLRLYFRMAAIRESADADNLQSELEAQYGPLPQPAETLVALVRLRLRLRAAGVKEVRTELGNTSLIFRKGYLQIETARHVLLDAFGEQVVAVTEDRVALNVPVAETIRGVNAAIETLQKGGATRSIGKQSWK